MFGKLVLTNNGLNLLSAILAGEEIEFTLIKMGKGTTAPTDIPNMTNVQDTAQILQVQRISKVNQTDVNIGANLMGSDVTEAFNWSEIGIFAKNNTTRGVEVMFSYIYTDNPVPIPIGGTVIEMLIDFIIAVGDSENINIELDSSLIFPTLEEVEQKIDQKLIPVNTKITENNTNTNKKIDDHIADKNNPHMVSKEDLSLGSVQNFGIASTAEAESGTLDTKYMTPKKVKEANNKYSIITDGNVILKVSSTQPAIQAGKTIIWIDTSS